MRRLFVAAEISDEAREVVASHADRVRTDRAPGIRWVKPQNFHVTLTFLGDCDEATVNDICRSVSEVCRTRMSIGCALTGPGVFPNRTRARVLWVGVDDGGALSEVVQRLDAALATAGLTMKRERFHPHITIGRVKDEDLARPIVANHLNLDLRSIRFSIDHLTVFESTLTPGGSIYTPLAMHRFAGD